MTNILPAGTYFVGDPCYAFSHGTDSWEQLLNETDYLSGDCVVEFKGHKMFAGGTAYGDGSYNDQFGYEYGVDAGLLGLVPYELIEDNSTVHQSMRKSMHQIDCGQIVTFTSEIKVECNGGVFAFTSKDKTFHIDTAGSDEEEDDDSYDDYDDEI